MRSTNIFNNLKNKNVLASGFIIAKNFIYISLNNGKLLKVNIEDGKINEIIKIDSNKISRPYVQDKSMYILKDNAIVKIE